MGHLTYDNQKDILKSCGVVLSEGRNGMATIRGHQDIKTWRWNSAIFPPGRGQALEIPEGVNLSARTPTRAAARALEYLLELVDRGELAS